MKKITTLILALLFLAGASLSAYAQEEDKWEAELTTYAFLPSMVLKPTMSNRSPTNPIEISFDELLDTFQIFDELYAFSSHFEMWKKWGILLNLDYIKLEDGGGTGPISGTIDIETLQIDAALGYKLGKLWLRNSGEKKYAHFIGWAGIQYNYLKENLGIGLTSGVLPVPGVDLFFGGDERWVELLLGLGVSIPVNEKLTLAFRGQNASFGVNDGTKENWWVIAGFDYQFSDRWSGKFAYKYWKFNYLSDGNEVGLDASFEGPWMGVSYHF